MLLEVWVVFPKSQIADFYCCHLLNSSVAVHKLASDNVEGMAIAAKQMLHRFIVKRCQTYSDQEITMDVHSKKYQGKK